MKNKQDYLFKEFREFLERKKDELCLIIAKEFVENYVILYRKYFLDFAKRFKKARIYHSEFDTIQLRLEYSQYIHIIDKKLRNISPHIWQEILSNYLKGVFLIDTGWSMNTIGVIVSVDSPSYLRVEIYSDIRDNFLISANVKILKNFIIKYFDDIINVDKFFKKIIEEVNNPFDFLNYLAKLNSEKVFKPYIYKLKMYERFFDIEEPIFEYIDKHEQIISFYYKFIKFCKSRLNYVKRNLKKIYKQYANIFDV